MQRHFVEKTQLDHNFLFLFFCGSRAMQNAKTMTQKFTIIQIFFYKYICSEKKFYNQNFIVVSLIQNFIWLPHPLDQKLTILKKWYMFQKKKPSDREKSLAL